MVEPLVEFAVLPVAAAAALATLLAFAVHLTGFRLADRARETSLDGRIGWVFLAGVVSGTGTWSAATLLVSTFAGQAGLRANLVVTAFFIAVAASLASFLIANRRSTPRALAAGFVAAAGLVAVIAIEVRALPLDPAPALSAGTTLTVLLAATLTIAAAHFAFRTPGVRRPSSLAAAIMAPAATVSCLLLLFSTTLRPGVQVFDGPAVIGSWGVAAAVALAVFLTIGTGMATALIHRDAEFASQRRLKRLADASVEGLAILDGNRVVEVNETLVRLIGRPVEHLRGAEFVGGLVTGDQMEEGGDPSLVREALLNVPGREPVPVEVVARPLDYDGRPHVVFAVRDLSDRRDAELRIRFLAEHDPLTALPNRTAFRRELERASAAVEAGGGSLALFIIDLDRFKEANDVFGHRAGDAVLVEVAQRLRGLLPEGATAARLGGDEFAVVVPGVPVPHGCAEIAQAIVAALAGTIDHEGQRIVVGGSVGVAVAPADGTSADLLVARADMALYRAKDQGGGVSCFFEVAMDEETRLRRMLAFELREAIGAGQLSLAYQPLVDLGSRTVTGFEALVRWEHPVHGTIAPTIFVAIAEESGFIAQLGEWVLRTAASEAARWERPLTVAVNLSPLQLEQQQLPDIVREILVGTGLSPTRLELEVTETALIRNPQRALDVLRRLKAMGIRIAMDDFGTGYSSLSTLQSFPFDKLKIDRSFVDRVGTHGQAASIVRAVVGLSRSLDIRVVAEGVETEAQIAFLSGEACDEVQGFMVGMPLPIQRYEHLTRGDREPPPAGRKRVAA